ncbi:MAG: hypothetical protein JNK48_16695 [Bryobacterales bacterium]|nr:hypothetical protein [Bryobacterales bacterium]
MNWLTLLVPMSAALIAGDARGQGQPSDSRIAIVESSLDQEPASLVRRCDSIRALLGEYRHTGKPALFVRAERLIAAALAQDSEYFEAKKMQAWALLLGGKTEQGLTAALALNKKMPDDVEVYGYLVDAYSALGKLEQAEEQANWMLRLRAENTETLRRVAELRERFGDTEGAVLAWNDLYRRIPETLGRDRAYVLARVAMAMKKTNPKRAKVVAAESLRMAPDSMMAKKAVAEVSE